MTMINMENDAVFLPGKIHGCEDELYIIYENECSNDGKGSMEIQIIDYKTILELYANVGGKTDEFFEHMPSYCKGYYAEAGIHKEYEDLCKIYPTADFIVGRDGSIKEEMEFIINWANERRKVNG